MGTPAQTKAVEKKVEYPLYEMEERGKLIIPPKIISQIQFLHSHCGTKEWSGMLLYDVIKGNPSKPEDFELRAEHIFLMDIGTAGATNYETDADIVDLFDEIPEAMEMKLGHIHTHHSGGAYFSGVDMGELQDNVDKHNYYLSLVVNFNGNYAAKVVFLSDMHTTAKMNFVNDAGETKHFKKAKIEKHMVVINMRIFYDEIGGFFSDRLDAIVKKETEKEKAAEAARKRRYSGSSHHNSHFHEHNYPSLPAHNQRPVGSKIIPDKMTSWEIENLTKNILMFDTELKTASNVYSTLHQIAKQMDEEGQADLYYDYLLNHIEKVIDAYFDHQLDEDEYLIVMQEVSMCVGKYEGMPLLTELITNLQETFGHFMLGYQNDVDEGEQSIADTIEKMEREMP